MGDVPFHTEETTTENKDRKTVEKYARKHKTHRKSNQDKKRAYMHIYTTTSDFTKASLHALQRAASDFLALFIRVSL